MAPDHTDPVQAVMGALVAASRRVGHLAGAHGEPEPEGPDVRYVALGALCVAEERLGATMRAGLGAARAITRPITSAAGPFVPASVRREVAATLQRLDAYGRSTVVAGSEEAGEFVAALTGEVAHEPVVLGMVEDIVASVLDTILPVILDRLTEEPEQVRALVQGQSLGMAAEVANAARLRAAAGDDAVESFLAKLLHRKARPVEPAPVPSVP